MNILQELVLLAAALVAAGQRPSFAGSRPIGYPELVNRTTTPSGLEDKFGEGTTQRLPIEAGGDRDLVDRLSKLPIDKQPFWFINWQAYEANREKPQTYPLRPNPFIDGNLQNTAITNTGLAISNSGSSVATAGAASANTGPTNPSPGLVDSQSGIDNKNGIPDVVDNAARIKFPVDDTNTKKNTPEKADTVTDDSTRKPDPPFVISVPLIPIYLNPANIETQNIDSTKDETKKPESEAPVENNDSKTPSVIPSDGSNSENIATTVTDINHNEPIMEPTKPETNTEIKSIETDRISDHKDKDSIADKKDEQLNLNVSDKEKPYDSSEDSKNVDTGTSTLRTYKYSKVVYSSEDDDYDDIKVKDDIKLFPGIIQKYRK